MYRVLPSGNSVPDPLEPELVGMAAEVAAAVKSAKALLLAVPEGTERRRLLEICHRLERAADHVLDPRLPVEHFSGVRAEKEYVDLLQYQEQAASLRAAARDLANRRDRPWRIFRRRRG